MGESRTRVKDDIYQDPILFYLLHLDKIRDARLTGMSRPATRLGDSNLFVNQEQEVLMNPVHLHSPTHFMEGFLFYIQLCAKSVVAVCAKVADRLEFFRAAWYYGSVTTQTIKYIKMFMHKHAKEMDWAALFRADAVNVNRYMEASTLVGLLCDDYWMSSQRGVPPDMRSSRADTDRGSRRSQHRRPHSSEPRGDRRNPKRSKSMRRRAPQVGGGSSTSKLFCTSRTIADRHPRLMRVRPTVPLQPRVPLPPLRVPHRQGVPGGRQLGHRHGRRRHRLRRSNANRAAETAKPVGRCGSTPDYLFFLPFPWPSAFEVLRGSPVSCSPPPPRRVHESSLVLLRTA